MQVETLPTQLHPQGESHLSRYQHLFLPCALVLVALSIRLCLIPTHEVISVDGTAYAVSARRLLSGDFSLLARYGFYHVLVAMAHLIVPDLELAGRLVSAVMGSLLILPIYFLGLTFYDRRVALYAACLNIAWPEMVGASCEVMTQATFNTLMMIGVLFTWQGFTLLTWRKAFVAGLALGLAYATRTEAIVLVVALCLSALVATLARKTGWQAVTSKVICPLAGGFLLILLPNLLLVHEESGTWQLAVKTSGALRDGLMYYLKLAVTELPPELDTVSYWEVLRDYPGYIPYSIAKNLTTTWQTMLPLSCWILAFIGFCADGWQRQAVTKRLYLAANFAPFLIIVIFYYVGPEYYQPYLPIMFLWIGRGITAGENLLQAITAPQILKQLTAFIPVPILIASCITSVSAYRLFKPTPTHQVTVPGINELDGRFVQKELGLMLKNALPAGKIMTRWARSAFYADREWAGIDARETVTELLATARKGNCRFLLVDQMATLGCPQITPLFAPAEELLKQDRPSQAQIQYLENRNYQPYPGLQLYMLYRNVNWVVAAIYQIVPEPI